MFGQTLQGSRKNIYDAVCRKYRKVNKLHEKADQALGEVLAEFELEGYAETQLDRDTQTISAMEGLQKGHRDWRSFYAGWRTTLEEFTNAGLYRDDHELFLIFLNKFPLGDRNTFMNSKSHYGTTFRKPRAWQEVAAIARDHYKSDVEAKHVDRLKYVDDRVREQVHAQRDLPSEKNATHCRWC